MTNVAKNDNLKKWANLAAIIGPSVIAGLTLIFSIVSNIIDADKYDAQIKIQLAKLALTKQANQRVNYAKNLKILTAYTAPLNNLRNVITAQIAVCKKIKQSSIKNQRAIASLHQKFNTLQSTKNKLRIQASNFYTTLRFLYGKQPLLGIGRFAKEDMKYNNPCLPNTPPEAQWIRWEDQALSPLINVLKSKYPYMPS